jgi:hypothetical protein
LSLCLKSTMAWGRIGELGVYLCALFDLDTRWRGDQLHAPATSLPGKESLVPVEEAEWAPELVWTRRRAIVQPVVSRYTGSSCYVCYHAKWQDPTLRGASVSFTSEFRTAAMSTADDAN